MAEDLIHVIALVSACWRYRLISGYKDRGNEGLGLRRASFPKCWKAGQRAEVSFGIRGGWGCNCRVEGIVVRCECRLGWGELW